MLVHDTATVVVSTALEEGGTMRPVKVALRDAARESETDAFHVSVTVDRRHGSELLTGFVHMDTGDAPIAWTPADGVHETYVVLRGRLEVSWNGVDSGCELLVAEDTFYFPPQRRYTLRNVGDEQVALVYSVVPAPERVA